MRLYTEEQVTELLKVLFKDDFLKAEDIIPTILGIALTPIELPSDEEIDEMGKDVIIYNDTKRGWFVEGLKYMRNKIQGGNK